MTSLKIPAEDALVLYQECPSDPVNGIRYIAVKFYEEWKWGIRYEVIVQDVLTEKFYSAVIEEQIRHYHLNWEDEVEITFDEVERVPVVTYEYKKVGYVE